MEPAYVKGKLAQGRPVWEAQGIPMFGAREAHGLAAGGAGERSKGRERTN